MSGVGSLVHPAVVTTTTAASKKAVTLLNWAVIAGYYTQAGRIKMAGNINCSLRELEWITNFSGEVDVTVDESKPHTTWRNTGGDLDDIRHLLALQAYPMGHNRIPGDAGGWETTAG